MDTNKTTFVIEKERNKGEERWNECVCECASTRKESGGEGG